MTSLMLPDELWALILPYVKTIHASVNLVQAVRHLWTSTRSTHGLWVRLVGQIPRNSILRRSHMGLRLKVIKWAAMHRPRCDRCPAAIASPLYYVGLKLCPQCCLKHLVPMELAPSVPIPYEWRWDPKTQTRRKMVLVDHAIARL